MSIEQEVGYMKGTIEAMDDRLTKVETKVDNIDEKVDKVLYHIAETRGGWKVISIISSVSAVLGALFSKLLYFIGFFRP
jgi:hypothetical protein